MLRFIPIFIAALLMLAWATTGVAQPPQQGHQLRDIAREPTRASREARELRTPSQAPKPPQSASGVNQRQAVNLAKQKFVGNVLRITLVGQGRNQRYQIRMENQGKVFTVFVVVATGQVSNGQ